MSQEVGPVTGDPVIDEAVQQLQRLAELPISAHVAEFEHAHAALRRVLDGSDSLGQ